MNSRRALAIIFCTVTLDVLALGLMIPVLPRIVLGFMGGDTAGAAEMFGAFATVWALIQFFFSPLLGAMSGRYGRRPVILVSCRGLRLCYIFMAMARSLALLFVGRVISGITSATIGTSFAYIADVTPRQRARPRLRPGRDGVQVGLRRRPRDRWVAGLPRSAPAAVGLGRGPPDQCRLDWYVLPESLPPEKRMAFAWKRANPVGSFCLLAAHRELLGLAAANFLGAAGAPGLAGSFRALRRLSLRLGRDQCRPQSRLRRCRRAEWDGRAGRRADGERSTLLLGLLCGALGMAIYRLAPTGLLFLVGVQPMAL